MMPLLADRFRWSEANWSDGRFWLGQESQLIRIS